jgi:hypothetical protein
MRRGKAVREDERPGRKIIRHPHKPRGVQAGFDDKFDLVDGRFHYIGTLSSLPRLGMFPGPTPIRSGKCIGLSSVSLLQAQNIGGSPWSGGRPRTQPGLWR